LAPPSPANTRLGCKLVMFLKTLVQKVLIGPKNKFYNIVVSLKDMLELDSEEKQYLAQKLMF